MSNATILVRAYWDAEAGVWVATSEDVPGLVTEAASPNELFEKLKVMIPELIELSEDRDRFPAEVPIVLMSEQVGKIRLRA